MKQFESSLFGGYKKADVDEYVAFLENELESLKAQTNELLQTRSAEITQLKEQAQRVEQERNTQSEELSKIRNEASVKDQLLENQSSKLAEKNAELREKDSRVEKLESELTETREKLSKAESSLQEENDWDNKLITEVKKVIRDVEEQARVKARGIENDAQNRADEIRRSSIQDAENYKKQAKEEINKEVENVKVSKYNFYEYLVSLKQSHDRLLETYEQMGALMKNFPEKMDRMISEAPFELVTDKEFQWENYDDVSMVEEK